MKFYWEFYKSTLSLNWGFSIAISALLYPYFFVILPIAITTGGSVISLFYKDIACKNEYYFYYNKGISKVHLLMVTVLLNGLMGFALSRIIEC